MVSLFPTILKKTFCVLKRDYISDMASSSVRGYGIGSMLSAKVDLSGLPEKFFGAVFQTLATANENLAYDERSSFGNSRD